MSIYVVFFGGFRASQPDMNLWQTSAEKQRNDVKFDAFPYPENAGAGDTDAANGFKQYDDVIKKIADVGADLLFIVGHSSGCAIANKLNSLIKGDHSRITLIDLDGFAPNDDQIKKSTVEVWSAEESGGKGKSLHWAAGHKKFISPSATQEWSLHFSLVNSAATDAITKENYRTRGYAGCIANLCWLPKKP
ncbi:MAG TPA: hypothetical protein VNU92_13005 [Edaphobacter sp.]|jgi:hypothetical protein|nr:hypothetical protein [Edaphobacter sp.]